MSKNKVDLNDRSMVSFSNEKGNTRFLPLQIFNQSDYLQTLIKQSIWVSHGNLGDILSYKNFEWISKKGEEWKIYREKKTNLSGSFWKTFYS